MLAKPRWPMNASDGSHFFLISSHFSSAESVMTYKFVKYRDAGVSQKPLQAVAYGRFIPW